LDISWIPTGKVARSYQKTYRVVLLEDYEGSLRSNAFGEGDVSRRDAHGNGGDSRRVFRQDVYSSLDAWHRESAEENEQVLELHEKHPFYSFEGTRYKGDRDIYMYAAMKYITNLRNNLTMNPERFMIRAVVALYTAPISQWKMGNYQWYHERSQT